jgi:hypothetical protein
LNLFGSAYFQLQVTDSSGQSTACILHDGVVYAGSNGIINLNAEGLTAPSQKLIGPLIQWGMNAWPWADDREKYELDLQIANSQPGTYWYPWWRNLQSGTVTITGGSASVVGSGTSFLSTICTSGGAPIDSDTVMIIQYPGNDGLTHYTPVGVVSCSDNTHAVLRWNDGGLSGAVYPPSANLPAYPYPDCDSGCSGLGYTVGDDSNLWGTWLYNSIPANYYDVAKAYYGFWLRSELTLITPRSRPRPTSGGNILCSIKDPVAIPASPRTTRSTKLARSIEASRWPGWSSVRFRKAPVPPSG